MHKEFWQGNLLEDREADGRMTITYVLGKYVVSSEVDGTDSVVGVGLIGVKPSGSVPHRQLFSMFTEWQLIFS